MVMRIVVSACVVLAIWVGPARAGMFSRLRGNSTNTPSQAQENVRVTRVKYAAGSATETEVLEAITLETIARTNYYRDDYELKRGYAKFIYAMGIDLGLVFEKMERTGYGTSKQ